MHGRPQVMLDPQLTQNLSLILHELVTNLLKYGALSVPDGSVQIKLLELPTGVPFNCSGTLQGVLLKFVQVFMVQTAQTAIANAPRPHRSAFGALAFDGA